MTEFKIEKNVPLQLGNAKGRSKYPFGEMKVGDSFVFTEEQYLNVCAAASWYGLRNNMKFSCSKVTLRVWRTE